MTLIMANSSWYNLFLHTLKMTGGHMSNHICPIHHCHLVWLSGFPKPVCPVRYQHILVNQSANMSNQVYRNAINRPKKHLFMQDAHFLENYSIINDAYIKNADFNNFNTKIKTSNHFKNTSLINRNLELLKIRTLTDAKSYTKCNQESNFNMILSGKPGQGKSHLAMSILKYVNGHLTPRPYSRSTHHFYRCMFVDVNELMRKIKDSFNNPNSDSEEHLVNVLSHVYLLVLDDIGTERGYRKDSQINMPYSDQILYEVLNNRSRTIFTTNLSANDLKKRYNPKLVSRLFAHVKHHYYHFYKYIPDARML